jgi:peptidyl-prolyl cis-trans isomerase SurA
MRTICTALCLFLFAAAPALAGDQVVARVGSEPITRMELDSAEALNPGFSRKAILESLIESRLILSWANQNHLVVAQEEIDSVERSLRENNNLTDEQFAQALADRGETAETFRDGLREQILINRAVGVALRDKMIISEEEIDKLYRKNYPAIETFALRHILFTVKEGAGDAEVNEVKSRAAGVMEQLREGASFEAMVRQHSRDSSSVDTGGKLGTFRTGELIPELEKAVVPLAVGEVGGPVKTAAGFHIVLVESRDTEDPPPLNTVRDELQESLMAEKEVQARSDWMQEIRDKSYVEVFEKSE